MGLSHVPKYVRGVILAVQVLPIHIYILGRGGGIHLSDSVDPVLHKYSTLELVPLIPEKETVVLFASMTVSR